MAAPLGIWQKIESIFFPVSVRKSSSAFNPVLELFYYRGRYILATLDAVYSDGIKYRPLLKAFGMPALKAMLPELENVLVLGTGLASAVHILCAKGFTPGFTLVEIDEKVAAWALEFLPVAAKEKVHMVTDDAFAFVAADSSCYDLIIVDIFFGRSVPEAVTAALFIGQCKARLRQGGVLVLNYMEPQGGPPGKAKAALEAAFDSVTEERFGINKVYLARNGR